MTRRSARLAAKQQEATKPAPVKKTRGVKKTTTKKAPVKKSSVPKKVSAKTSTLKKRTNTSSGSPVSKKRRTGLSKAVAGTSALGVVDPESNIEGTIEVFDGEPCDVMLALVDPAKNMDKFFVLQLIRKDSEGSDEFVVYTRWGRTGTAGQALVQDFDTLDDARTTFEKKFKQKTGLNWDERDEPTKGGKYRFVKQDFANKRAGYTSAIWQYWVDDGVDGKETGWYDYTREGSIRTERLFSEHACSGQLPNRFVESGAYTYDVDLVRMVQTNVSHPNRTSRRIRRCPEGTDMSNDQPAPLPMPAPSAVPSTTTSSSSSKVALTPATPVKTTSAPASAPTTTAVKSEPAPKKSGSHPVDVDISIVRRNVSDFEVVQNDDGIWYDVVLNQCNIANNNNKYYRIQMLKAKSGRSFYVWQKWGRVGEPARASASAFKGPFASEEKAYKEFASKYKAKTANPFGAEEFVPRHGKYTPIEIDNDVEVSDEFTAAQPEVKIEYLPSRLDKKTRELVEVLFSKDMRDQALTSFNIDLQKLPLGVPSQQQIQHGVSILNQIEDKLNGTRGGSSYQSLSSEFYTAIPHSFGRQRPPVIMDRAALQSRYDMCNILLDMYETNETIKKIEKEAKTTEVEKVPHPIDSHYESLKAELSLVDKKSKEFSHIKEYFNKTKPGGHGGTMLDVWAVNREGEGERFSKYKEMDNRRLLWHGTNIAVVAPILTSGLRIMPHSGGRVGSGIYLASMQEKSAQYTSGYGAKFACMFLAEAALGRMHEITQDGQHAYSLKKAPKGSDSVLAVGRITPDTWGTMEIDGNEVQIPQSKAKQSGVGSSFHHDEFLAYDEAQVRLRYVITVKL